MAALMTAKQRKGFMHESGAGRSIEWYTPPELFDALGLSFDLDPASPPGGVPWVPAARHFSVLEDGLAQPWQGRIWLNPPYGRGIGRWLDRLADHGDGLALVFARTDTAWWADAFPMTTAICFIKGRLSFVTPSGTRQSTAGAPSVLLAYGLPCALALAQSELGPTCLVPRGSRA
jgi:hypothetical protein